MTQNASSPLGLDAPGVGANRSHSHAQGVMRTEASKGVGYGEEITHPCWGGAVPSAKKLHAEKMFLSLVNILSQLCTFLLRIS